MNRQGGRICARSFALLVFLFHLVLTPIRAESLSVLTYNAWHGFWRSPEQELLVLPSEGRQEREVRQRRQLIELERAAPDLLLVQEAHALPWRAREIARSLGHRSIHQLVSCGLRFLHLGVPWNIRSGLILSARPDLALERLAAPVLSGRIGFCGDWVGLQTEETRRALLGRISLADGRRLLVATTHLHSSTVGGRARTERRVREVQALLRVIEEMRAADPAIAGVIIGGDLNALSDSRPIALVREAGFVDVAERLDSEFPTYDPWTNALAARMVEAGGGQAKHSAPRRIDYLFVSPELASGLRAVKKYGEAAAAGSTLTDSDHFGVWLELDL